MKTIFISIPWFVPAFKAGGPIQSIANMVYELNEGYRFYIYTSNTDLHGLPIAVAITNEWVEYNAHTKVWYANKKNRSQQLVDQVKSIKPDQLFIIGLFNWHFNIVPMLYAACADKLVSVRGMLHPGALGQKGLKKKLFLKAMQWMKLDRKCRFHATDEAEAGYIKNILGPHVQVAVAGNFPRLFPLQEPVEKEAGTLQLISVGIISPMKNYLRVIEALAGMRAVVRYTIYGPVKEPAYWEQCLEAIKALPANITVQYHPELPAHKVAAKLTGEQVFILPSKSENYGHAIAEALSAGLPVISSHAVPWLALKGNNAGVNVDMEAGDAGIAALAEAMDFFAAMGQEEYDSWRRGAAAYVRKRVNREELVAAYDRMFGGER
ncbi:MAG: glycosyltransferase [Chitinophagaceae bacterium]|nr:MAG: glycosyltransferase [Chitinophagaceae bacterium]